MQDAASSSGEEDGEDDAPIRRTQRPAGTNALADSDDDGADAPSAKVSVPAAAANLASKQQGKRKTVLDEDSVSDEDWDAPQRAAGGHTPFWPVDSCSAFLQIPISGRLQKQSIVCICTPKCWPHLL